MGVGFGGVGGSGVTGRYSLPLYFLPVTPAPYAATFSAGPLTIPGNGAAGLDEGLYPGFPRCILHHHHHGE